MSESLTRTARDQAHPGPVRRLGLVSLLGGGVVGSAVRIAVGDWLAPVSGAFPWSTLAVNLTGAMLLGFYLARRNRGVAPLLSVHFWAIGVLGSFTTFSSFSLEVVRMLDHGMVAGAARYLAASVFGGLLAVVAGDWFGTRS